MSFSITHVHSHTHIYPCMYLIGYIERTINLTVPSIHRITYIIRRVCLALWIRPPQGARGVGVILTVASTGITPIFKTSWLN